MKIYCLLFYFFITELDFFMYDTMVKKPYLSNKSLIKKRHAKVTYKLRNIHQSVITLLQYLYKVSYTL